MRPEDPIDRLAPTARPPGPNAGTQRWRELLFVHFELPIERVRSAVPAELELDLWEGRALVGLVPFLMRDIAPRFVPSALGLNFLECNLRTYVHHRGAPGVYFLSLEADSALAVRVARRFWGLPYFDARMRQVVSASDGTAAPEHHFETVREGDGALLRARWRVGEALGPSLPDTLEHFLLERYLLFVERDDDLHAGQVHHAPYPVHRAELISLEQTLTDAAGLGPTRGEPMCAHYSPGVDVEVFATGRRAGARSLDAG
jgi:uncharacterized protein